MTVEPSDLHYLHIIRQGDFGAGMEADHREAVVARLEGMGFIARALFPSEAVGLTESGKAALDGQFTKGTAIPRVTSMAWVQSLNMVLAHAGVSVDAPPLADSERAKRLFTWDCINDALERIPSGLRTGVLYGRLTDLAVDAQAALVSPSLAPAEALNAASAAGMDLWEDLRQDRAGKSDGERTRATVLTNAAACIGYGLRNVPQGPASAARQAASVAGALAYIEAGGDSRAKGKARDEAEKACLKGLAKKLEERLRG